MGQMSNAYNIFIGKHDRTKPAGRSGRRWEDNIRMDLKYSEMVLNEFMLLRTGNK
jgi:hypothetical protein